MAVVLTVSSTFSPATPYADVLLGGGGGNTGIDFGVGTNNQYTPIINKTANTGSLPVYLSHNGTAKITELRTHIQTYGTSTGYAYGGTDTAANDYITMHSTLGLASGSSKNNADGNSAGLWGECNAALADGDANFFDRPLGDVKVFGDSGNGIDLATAYTIPTTTMIYDSGGETAATSPVAGELGVSGDSVLGDRSLIRYRVFFPDSFAVGGTIQFEIVYTYAFTV
jgi:hypothetical protein